MTLTAMCYYLVRRYNSVTTELQMSDIQTNCDSSAYWMGCDYLGADLPVMNTESLSKYEIYAYWQLALAVVAGNI